MRAAFVATVAATVASAESGIQVLTDTPGVPEVPKLEVPKLEVPKLEVPNAPPRYDCSAEYDSWQTAWTPDWKAWCCEHESKGCPSTTTTTATSSTSTQTTTTRSSTSTATTTSTTGLGCDAVCEIAHVNATCGERIRWLHQYGDVHVKNHCHASHSRVVSECSICGGCSIHSAGCGNKEKEHKEEKHDKTFMFKKYEVSSQADSAAPGRAPLGFFARCSLAGVAAGVPLAIVLRRGLRHPGHSRQVELGQQLYESAAEQGTEVVAE